MTGIQKQIRILYEDNHLLIVDKPAGILSQADASGDPDILTMAKEMIRVRDQKPGNVYLGLVHRLDRNVGGVFILAKTSKAAARISEQIRKSTLKKFYVAAVEKGIRSPEGLLVHYTKKDTENRMALPARPGELEGKEARLYYKRMDEPGTPEGLDLLEIELLTGRFHQIRFQLSQIGHPIAGDRRYGSRFKLDGSRLALRAIRVELVHPTRKEILKVQSPLPEGWPLVDPDFVK